MDEDVIFIPVDADASDDIPADTVHDSDSSSAGDPEIPDASILTSRGRHCCKSACVERFHDDQNLRDQHAAWLELVRSQSKPVQDEFMFHILLSLAQDSARDGPGADIKHYTLLGVKTCRRAFQMLSGFGSYRIHRLTAAIGDGLPHPPVDLRGVREKHCGGLEGQQRQ